MTVPCSYTSRQQMAEEVLQMRRSRSLLSAADERLLEEIHALLVRYETKRRRHHKKQSPTRRVKQQVPESTLPFPPSY